MGNTQSYRLGKPFPLVVEHNGQKTTIPRNSDYQKTIASIKKNIRSLKAVSDDQLILLTLLKEVDDHVQITPDQWADFLPRLNLIRVKLDNELNASSVFSDNCRQCPTPLPAGEQIILMTRMGRTTTYNVNLSTLTVYDLKELIEDKEGDPVGRQLLTFDGRRLMDKKRLADYGIKNGSTIQISSNIRAKKTSDLSVPPKHNIKHPSRPLIESNLEFLRNISPDDHYDLHRERRGFGTSHHLDHRCTARWDIAGSVDWASSFIFILGSANKSKPSHVSPRNPT